jgi:NAD(P)-dependent dehydrogenase (short-subunit alcohol dehydrogenase family)
MAETAMTELPRARLDGRHALVTGALSGLGRHFAEVVAAAGARVSLAARRVESLAVAVDAIAVAGGGGRAVPLDVTDEPGVEAAFDQAEAWGGPVQILINNAGVATTRPALELAEEDWDTTLDTNLKGAWLVAREAGRRLIAHRAPGTIVNVASILGVRVAGSVAAYATSKAGLLQLTQGARARMGAPRDSC